MAASQLRAKIEEIFEIHNLKNLSSKTLYKKSTKYLDWVTLTNEFGNFGLGQVASRLFKRSLKIWKTSETKPMLFVKTNSLNNIFNHRLS